MCRKFIPVLSLFLFLTLGLLGQTGNSFIQSSVGDTTIVPVVKRGSIIKEKYYLNGQLVLEKEYYKRKGVYGYRLKDPGSSNKKAFTLKEFYLNGQLRIDGSSLDGKNPNGHYRTFYENGRPQCICNYKNGRRDGTQLTHFDNGQLWAEVIYTNGVPWNIVRTFNKDGKAVEAGTLRNGNGTFLIYDSPDKPIKIEHYKLGVLIRAEKFKN